MTSLNLHPAIRLLAHWSPGHTSLPVSGSVPDPRQWPWTTPPDLAQLASVFPHRNLVSAEVLSYAIDGGHGKPWKRSRAAGEVAAEVAGLLLDTLSTAPAETVRELVAEIAHALAEFGDLARLAVADADGVAIGGELHLVGRDLSGRITGLSLTRSGAAGDPVERAACAAKVLGGYVWVTNNDRMDVEIASEEHGLAPFTDEAFRAWWPTSATSAAFAGEYWDEEPELAVLDEQTLVRFRAEFAEHNLVNARGGAWAMGLIDDGDDDAQSDFPGARLVETLTAEIFDDVIALVDGPVHTVYGLGIPTDLDEDDYGILGALLFAGPERVGALLISAVA